MKYIHKHEKYLKHSGDKIANVIEICEKKIFCWPNRRINIESRLKIFFFKRLSILIRRWGQKKCFSPHRRINIESRSKKFLWNNFLIWLEDWVKKICSHVVAKNKSFTFYVRFLFLSISDYTTVAFVVCIFLFMSQSITELW